MMKSFFIPAGSSIKVQLKVCHRVAEMPAQRTGGGVEEVVEVEEGHNRRERGHSK